MWKIKILEMVSKVLLQFSTLCFYHEYLPLYPILRSLSSVFILEALDSYPLHSHSVMSPSLFLIEYRYITLLVLQTAFPASLPHGSSVGPDSSSWKGRLPWGAEAPAVQPLKVGGKEALSSPVLLQVPSSRRSWSSYAGPVPHWHTPESAALPGCGLG